ncbi:MAG: TSUP family transporter, partial [Bacteroidota bacterium]
SAGHDLVKANALKVFIVLLYSPFALAVFMIEGQIHYGMGLIASIGNIIGAIVASHYAVSWGPKVIRWILIVVLVLFASKLLGIFKLFN